METSMAAQFSWLEENWFHVLEASGITFGLFFTAATLRQQIKARKISDHLLLNQQHRELWSELYRRPALARILERDLDLQTHPMTAEEEEFLNLVIVHFVTGWHLAKQGALIKLKVLKADVGDFFNRPLPHLAWTRSKEFRDPAFNRFVETCLEEKKT
jgi:hypothetical protein